MVELIIALCAGYLAFLLGTNLLKNHKRQFAVSGIAGIIVTIIDFVLLLNSYEAGLIFLAVIGVPVLLYVLVMWIKEGK